MSHGLEQLRMAAALAHASADADLELVGPGRRWLVSFDRVDATVDPCRFRQLVLATMQGRQVGLQPVQELSLVGGLEACGGGLFRRMAEGGEERRFVTCLPAAHVATLLDSCPFDLPDQAMAADIQGDDELHATVVVVRAVDPAYVPRLEEVARWALAACLVEELLVGIGSEATS